MSLSASNRFSLKDSRESFFASGKSIHSPLLQVIYLKESKTRHSGHACPRSIGDSESIKDNQPPLFSILVSKKVAKKAHDRNKLRRQIQQLIQTNLSSFPPHKYLFLPKNSAINSYSELKASFTELLSKLN